MSEVLSGIYNDAYYFAVNSGASEEDAYSFARDYCDDIRSQLIEV